MGLPFDQEFVEGIYHTTGAYGSRQKAGCLHHRTGWEVNDTERTAGGPKMTKDENDSVVDRLVCSDNTKTVARSLFYGPLRKRAKVTKQEFGVNTNSFSK